MGCNPSRRARTIETIEKHNYGSVDSLGSNENK